MLLDSDVLLASKQKSRLFVVVTQFIVYILVSPNLQILRRPPLFRGAFNRSSDSRRGRRAFPTSEMPFSNSAVEYSVLSSRFDFKAVDMA